MRNVNFTKVGFENYKNYTELTEYQFIQDTISIVTGPNGSGKTSMFDAIPFCLFGSTPDGRTSDDVVNDRIGKNCQVYVEFNINDDKYRVERYVKYKKYGTLALLYKNDFSNPIKKGHREVLSEIENIFLSEKLFSNVLFFGQKVKTFFTDLKDTERKEIFREVLPLDEYTNYYKMADSAIKIKSEEETRTSNEIEVNSQLLKTYERQLISYSLQEQEFIKKKDDDIIELHSLISETKSKIDEAEKYINSKLYVNHEIDALKSKESDIRNRSKSIVTVKDYEMSEVNAKKLEKENSLLTSYNSKKADIEKEKQDYIKSWEYDVGPKITLALGKLGDIRSEILNNKSEIKITSDNINALTEKIDSSKTSLSLEQPRCYECNSEVGIEERKILVEKLAQRESKKSELVDKLSELNKMLDKNLIIEAEKKKEHSNCVLSLETAKKIADEKAAEKLKSLKSAYDTSIDKLESIVREKKRNVTDKHASDIIRLDGELDNIRLDLVALNKEAKIIEEKTQTLNREKEYLMKYTVRMESLKNSEFDDMQMKDAKEKILELTEKQSLLNDRLKTLKNDMEKMLFWKAGFSSTGIPAMLIDEVIPYMNDRIMFYLSKIGPRFVVSFDTISTTKDGSIRDKIGINVLDTVTLSNSRKKLSPGQARIIDIATIFTLKDLQSKIQEMNTNIIILDEIFDSLDDINIGFVSDLLRTLVEGKCINIISHRYIDQIEADNIYRL